MIKSIKTENMEVEYAVFGSGSKPLIIIPGLSLRSVMQSADTVEEHYKDGKNDFTFYLIDRRKNAPENYTIEEMAEDTVSVMKKIGIQKACVFGASQGGMIAQCIAAEYPLLVEKLFLCSTLARSNPTMEAVTSIWASLAKAGKVAELLSDMLSKIYSPNTLKIYREILIKSFENITDYELKQFEIMANAANGFSSLDKICRIESPVKVVGSVADRVTTAEGSLKLAKAIGCELYLYGNSYGHGVYDEAKDFTQNLFEFFNR